MQFLFAKAQPNIYLRFFYVPILKIRGVTFVIYNNSKIKSKIFWNFHLQAFSLESIQLNSPLFTIWPLLGTLS